MASSSLPPSSPSPTDLPPDHESIGDTFPGEEIEVEATPVQRKMPKTNKQKDNVPVPVTSVEEETERATKPTKKVKSKGKARASAAQQSEEEPDAAKRSDQEVEPKEKNGREQSKRKARAPAAQQDKDQSDHEGVKKPGRLSKETIEEAHALRQNYHDELEALARRDGKSVAALLSAVGDTVLDNRSLNPWNAFQAYATHPEGLAMERCEDQSIADFNSEILTAYREKRAEAEDVEHAFDDVIEWYRKELDDQTAKMRMEGLTLKQLNKILKPFNARVSIFIVYTAVELR